MSALSYLLAWDSPSGGVSPYACMLHGRGGGREVTYLRMQPLLCRSIQSAQNPRLSARRAGRERRPRLAVVTYLVI